MKETTTTYYDDVTGEEIGDLFEMMSIKVNRPRNPPRPGDENEVIHLAGYTHGLEYERIDNNSFEIYIGDTGNVAMVVEDRKTRTSYYGRDTEDQEIAGLIDVLDGEVLDDDG